MNITKMLKSTIIIIILAITLLCGCKATHEGNQHSTQIYALDTVIELTAYGDDCKEAVSAATGEIYRLEKLLSATNENSDIFKLNASEGEAVKVSDETYFLLSLSKELNTATKGNFDITIYPVIKLWGFTTDKQKVPTLQELSKELEKVNSENIILAANNTVTLKNGAMCDLGGIAKGYIADKAANAMKEAGADYGIISLGGNIRTVGTKTSGDSWNIGVLYPDSKDYFATIQADECSVVTSGGYQRNFTEDEVIYHHIIDPATGYPSKSDIVSVTIVGKDGAVCDALSTALYIGGSDYANELYKERGDFEYVILTKDQEVIASKGLENTITLSDSFDLSEIIYK